jgi:hypothetical protein
VKRGDWRTSAPAHPVSTEEWLNRFGDNQANLAKIHEKG